MQVYVVMAKGLFSKEKCYTKLVCKNLNTAKKISNDLNKKENGNIYFYRKVKFFEQ